MGSLGQNDPFGELFGELAERLRGHGWQPALDVFETSTEVVIRAEIAGVPSGGVKVSMDGDVVKIAGNRKPLAVPEPVERLHQMEILYGPFECSVRVSVPLKKEEVNAHLEDGLLTVTLPKRVPQSRTIAVSQSEEEAKSS